MKTKHYEYRIRILPDQEPYEYGDTGNTMGQAEYEAEIDRLIETYGVWGFITERRQAGSCECCKRAHEWEHMDSCWGFLGNDTFRQTLTRLFAHVLQGGR
jgi:hypothetical protein